MAVEPQAEVRLTIQSFTNLLMTPFWWTFCRMKVDGTDRQTDSCRPAAMPFLLE